MNFNLFSQKSSSLSQQSLCSQSASQQRRECSNCGAPASVLEVDSESGHQVCTQCSHIVEGFEDMQSSRDFRDGADREMQSQQHDILRCAQQQRWQPLNKELIRPQRQLAALIVGAFQCVLQAQTNALIRERGAQPHVYDIVGHLWFRFLNKAWIARGFGARKQPCSLWVWNKNEQRLFQNDDFEEKWATPKHTVIDVLLTTESDSSSSSSSSASKSNKNNDRIDLDSLNLSDASVHSTVSSVSCKTRKRAFTEKEKKRHERRKRLERRRRLPTRCGRYTGRIPRRDPFGWKTAKHSNMKSSLDRYLYRAGEINLELSLLLLSLACRICAEAVTLNELLRMAQKDALPYLRAFEALPKRFRVRGAKERRRLFATDANALQFERFFQRNEMRFEAKYFYLAQNLLARELGVLDKVVPLNSKLMALRYCRDLKVPLALHAVARVLMDKLRAHRAEAEAEAAVDVDVEPELQELSEFESPFVAFASSTAQRKRYEFEVKLLFTNGLDGQVPALDMVSVAALLVIAVLCVYRLDKALRHPLNERPPMNSRSNKRRRLKRVPPLWRWFAATSLLKHRFADADSARLFGVDADRAWRVKLTRDFIERLL